MIERLRRTLVGGALWVVVTSAAIAGSAAAAPGASDPPGHAALTDPIPAHRFGVGEIVVTYTDPTRYIWLAGHRRVPRRLVTVIRYPAALDPSRVDVLSAPPEKAAGPFPLVVFGHGYKITPAPYSQLLRAWASAGYVVAAPLFPLTNAAAPGGPDEADLVNQPTDMSFVITQILGGSARSQGILSGLVDPREIAVTGQSDGGSTALAVAYNQHYIDHRIGAAIILSGAMIPGVRDYDFPPPSPPLLAVQGTADTMNLPASTYRYFARAPQPKFLLSLLGAPHLGPYTDEWPQLGIVERTTLAFLDRYLQDEPGAAAQMERAGNVPGVARLRG